MADRKFDLLKQPAEKFTIGIDFANDLGTSETISSATMAAVDVADDSDVSGTIFDGSASVVNGDATLSKITQKIKAGTDGHQYKITFQANTSESNIFVAEVFLAVEGG